MTGPSGHLAAPGGRWHADPNGVPVVGECCISFGSVVDEKKRGALSGALEWRPTDTLSFTLDGLYTKLDDPQVAYNQAYYPDFNYDANGNPEWSNVVVITASSPPSPAIPSRPSSSTRRSTAK